ncbi:MAG: ABC transporter permease [Candidatus Heimdallarchaeota archaeon]
MSSTKSLRAYFIHRLILVFPMIFILLTFVFLILRVIPGDPVRTLAGLRTPEEVIQAEREALGLNDPIWVQYIRFIHDMLRFDFGETMGIRKGFLVKDELFFKFPATMELAIFATLVAYIVGVRSGTAAAVHRNTVGDAAARVYAIGIFSIPIFWFGIMMIFAFAVRYNSAPIIFCLGIIVSFALIEEVGLHRSTKKLSFASTGILLAYDILFSILAKLDLVAALFCLGIILAFALAERRGHTLSSKYFWMGIVLTYLFTAVLYPRLLARDLFPLVQFPMGFRISSEDQFSSYRRTGLYFLDSLLGIIWPPEGMNRDPYWIKDVLTHLTLPSITLGLYLSGFFSRMTRVNVLEMLRMDFVTAARARGIPEKKVVRGHALRNAYIPIVTVAGMQFALLLGGAILTETTFNWPGIGRYIYEGIQYRDYAVVQGGTAFFAIMVAIVSLIIDLLYAYLDPRIRY